MELVKITRFTLPASTHARRTFRVPSTAGLINTYDLIEKLHFYTTLQSSCLPAHLQESPLWTAMLREERTCTPKQLCKNINCCRLAVVTSLFRNGPITAAHATNSKTSSGELENTALAAQFSTKANLATAPAKLASWFLTSFALLMVWWSAGQGHLHTSFFRYHLGYQLYRFMSFDTIHWFKNAKQGCGLFSPPTTSTEQCKHSIHSTTQRSLYSYWGEPTHFWLAQQMMQMILCGEDINICDEQWENSQTFRTLCSVLQSPEVCSEPQPDMTPVVCNSLRTNCENRRSIRRPCEPTSISSTYTSQRWHKPHIEDLKKFCRPNVNVHRCNPL